MKINKEYRKLENVEEINLYDVDEKGFYVPTPQEFDVEDMPFPKLLNSLPIDIHTLLPYENCSDLIVQSLGGQTIERWGFTQEDVKGRLLSKISPMIYRLMNETFKEVYATHESKEVRFIYKDGDKFARLTNVKVIYEMERIFVLTDHVKTPSHEAVYEEDKLNMMEYFSQSGSYSKINGKYTWTQGVYNIINRPREETDEHYNIVFDLAIKEDKDLVEKIQKILDTDIDHYEDIIRIRTHDGVLKYIEIDIYSNFDENGKLTSRYGLMKDVTQHSKKIITKPVDFLLDGFKNSKKISLLIEPLNKKQYEFSKGFYNLIEVDANNYHHSRDVINNISEKQTKENLLKLYYGELDKVDETFTYRVNGDEDHIKICELYIERFNFGETEHSIGFLSDVTEDKRKQQELQNANEHQKILIKEVHHRVKNNLQILNSFLNLEKRVYKDNPDTIVEHMQSRLISLALLHEKTYNATDFKNINLKDYITDQDNQFKTLSDLQNDIEFITAIDESINLSVEVITPLSLIINEITLNTIKHAFPDKSVSDKKLIKEITKIDETTARLIIKDNGIGIKDSKQITQNLGCEIIKSLTQQLNGNIKLLKLKKGTGYELTFPLTIAHTITQ